MKSPRKQGTEVLPPIHLGIKKDAWNSELQQDWEEFQAQQQEDLVERLVFVHDSKSCFFFAIWTFVLANGLGSQEDVPNLGVGAALGFFYTVAMMGAGHYGASVLRRLVCKYPTTTGTLVQMAVLLGLLIWSCSGCLKQENQVLQHRIFIVSWAFIILMLCLIGYFTFWAHVCVSSPAILSWWLVFHQAVGWLDTRFFVNGVIVAVVPIGISVMLERLRWQTFIQNRNLVRERHVLLATQETLHSMLSSLWDASCTCSAGGQILSSTPHLEQMVGGSEGLIGENFSCLAAGRTDKARLDDFLRNVASGTEQQALTLQCSVQARRRDSDTEEDVQRAKPIEIRVYGIKLPAGASFQRESGCSDTLVQTLFIGIKANILEASAARLEGPSMFDAKVFMEQKMQHEATSTRTCIERQVSISDQGPPDSHAQAAFFDQFSDDDDLRSSGEVQGPRLSSSSENPDEFSNFPDDHDLTGMPGQCTEMPEHRPKFSKAMSVSSRASSLAYTQYSVASTSIKRRRLRCEVSTQTSLSTICAGTQTEYARPPALPPSSEPGRQEINAFMDKHIRYGRRLMKKMRSNSAPPAKVRGCVFFEEDSG